MILCETLFTAKFCKKSFALSPEKNVFDVSPLYRLVSVTSFTNKRASEVPAGDQKSLGTGRSAAREGQRGD